MDRWNLSVAAPLLSSLDLAPAHAGLLVGLQGTAGNVAGMVSPALGGLIVARTGGWDLNFYVIAALLAAGIAVWARWPAPSRSDELLCLHRQLDRGACRAPDLDHDREGAEVLQGLVQADAAPVDVEPLLGEQPLDVEVGDGAE